jgi:hypothetical protein
MQARTRNNAIRVFDLFTQPASLEKGVEKQALGRQPRRVAIANQNSLTRRISIPIMQEKQGFPHSIAIPCFTLQHASDSKRSLDKKNQTL